MRLLSRVNLTALGVGSFIAGLGFLSSSGQGLHASGNSWAPLVDTDGDGLDDALEARLNTAADSRDSDGDGFTDTEELILRANPLAADTALPTPAASMYVNTYALGTAMYFQVFLLSQGAPQSLSGVWVNAQDLYTFSSRQLRRFRSECLQLPAPSLPGWKLRELTFRLPRAPFEAATDSSVGFRVIMDGQVIADQLPFTHVDGSLVQFVPLALPSGDEDYSVGALETGGHSDLGEAGGQGGGEAATGGGGLFPVDPGEGQPPQGTSDQVCYQVLAPVADLGGGRVLYQVISAGCESMVRAVCFTGCSATVGDQYVLTDVVALLGG